MKYCTHHHLLRRHSSRRRHRRFRLQPNPFVVKADRLRPSSSLRLTFNLRRSHRPSKHGAHAARQVHLRDDGFAANFGVRRQIQLVQFGLLDAVRQRGGRFEGGAEPRQGKLFVLLGLLLEGVLGRYACGLGG